MWPFKKKKEKKEAGEKEDIERISSLPELPELPPLPRSFDRLETLKNELPALSSFSKISGEKRSREPVRPSKIPEIAKRTKEITKMPVRPVTREINPEIKAEPIFIRIDKYREAMSEFQEVKNELIEIENLLRDIKDIRAREEAQLQGWEEEVQDAKSKLNNIDKTIFQQLEE